MAVGTPVSLVSLDDQGTAQTYTTTSITPPADTVVIAVVHPSKATSLAADPLMTVTGCNLTWTTIGGANFNTVATPLDRIQAAWGISGAPVAGTLSFAMGVNQNGCSWSVFYVPGCHPTAPIVASSFKSASGNAGTTASVVLNTIASAQNGYIVATGLDLSTAVTPRGSWTTIHDVAGAAPVKRTHTQYRLGVDDDASSTFASADWGLIGWELAAAPPILDVPDGSIFRTRFRGASL